MLAVSRIQQYICLCLVLCLLGCGKKAAMEEKFREPTAQFANLAGEKTVQVRDDAYIPLNVVPIDDANAPLLSVPVTLRVKAGLPEICDTLIRMVPVHVSFVRDEEDRDSVQPSKIDPELSTLLGEDLVLPKPSLRLSINYEGSLKGLLDHIAAQSGYGWDYVRASNTITFAKNFIKTFVLKTAPGKINFGTTLTNQSKESSQAGESKSDRSAQISQKYQGELFFDTFNDTIRNIKGMLSKNGVVFGNEAAGTVSVRDSPDILRQVERYIDQVNANFSKQVAMKVNVYSLEVNDTNTLGVELSALLPSVSVGGGSVSLGIGSLSKTASLLGSAQAMVLDGQLKGSSAVLRALQNIGKARQITSAGIVTLNNQPAPVEAIQKIAYLAGSTTETSDHGTQTSLTPGEVTTGFSMTITPHILEGRKVVLQYNVHLSSLDSLESFESNKTTIQLPRISTRAFSQKATVMMGQTLVLAGFQHARVADTRQTGLLSLQKSSNTESSLIIVTIELENAAPHLQG